MEALLWIVPLGVIGVGGFVVFMCVKALFDAGKQRGWQTTTGVIRESSVKATQVGGWTVTTSGWSGTAPRVTYTYEVDGKPYTATGFGWRRRRQGFLGGERTTLSNFAEGATVPVHYDPADPSRSVLMRSSFGCGPIFGIGVGLMLMLFGWGFLKIASMAP